MQLLSETEAKLIERRSRLIRIWPYAGTASLAGVVIMAGYLIVANPLLINPFYVIAQIEADSIPQSTLLLLAVIAPLAVLLSLLILVVMIAYVFAAMGNEKRLIAIVDRLRGEAGGQATGGG